MASILKYKKNSSSFYKTLPILADSKQALLQLKESKNQVILFSSLHSKSESAIRDIVEWTTKNLGSEWKNKLVFSKDPGVIQATHFITDKLVRYSHIHLTFSINKGNINPLVKLFFLQDHGQRHLFLVKSYLYGHKLSSNKKPSINIRSFFSTARESRSQQSSRPFSNDSNFSNKARYPRHYSKEGSNQPSRNFSSDNRNSSRESSLSKGMQNLTLGAPKKPFLTFESLRSEVHVEFKLELKLHV